jgi:hypothetical protein
MKPQQPPDDALLWRVETDHSEVVCYVVAAPDGGVALCVERNEELLVAESHWSEPSNAPRSCVLHSQRLDCRPRGTTDAIATEAARPPRCPRIQSPTKARTAVAVPAHVLGSSVKTGRLHETKRHSSRHARR